MQETTAKEMGQTGKPVKEAVEEITVAEMTEASTPVMRPQYTNACKQCSYFQCELTRQYSLTVSFSWSLPQSCCGVLYFSSWWFHSDHVY